MNWISVKEKLPETNTLVLAYTGWQELALAKLRETGNWEVQPYCTAWYGTFNGVLYWQPLEEPEA